MKTQDIQDVIAAATVPDILEILKSAIENPMFPAGISPLSLTCAKTGNIVGFRDEKSVQTLARINGPSFTLDALFYAHGNAVAPHWLFTDGKSLDALMDADTIGYICYCLNSLTKRFYEEPAIKRGDLRKAMATRHWALARANSFLTQANLAQDVLENVALSLCGALTYQTETFQVLTRILGKRAKSPDAMALLIIQGELPDMLEMAIDAAYYSLQQAAYAGTKRSIRHHVMKKWPDKEAHFQVMAYEIYRGMYQEIPSTPEDMAKGPSNIRLQNPSRLRVKQDRRRQQMDVYEQLLGHFFKDETTSGEPIVPLNVSSLSARLAIGISDVPDAEDLGILANMTLDDLAMFADVGANEVEVRVMTPQDVADYEAEKPVTLHELAEEPAVPIAVENSMAARLRARLKL